MIDHEIFFNCLYIYASRTVAKLLQSVKQQTVYPNEILIIDGSKDDATQTVLQLNFLII
jgi:glycosyltransferase involved in cell wall biosynthesis